MMTFKNSNFKKWPLFITPILLSITTIFFYYSSLWYQFIFDDLPTITHNFHILRAKGNILQLFFSSNRWMARTLNTFLYRNWQTNTFPYRIVNLSIHILIGILIFILLYNLISNFYKSPFLQKNAFLVSTIASGLFLLHPVQTQTVTYITQMQLEGLATLFIFATLVAFIYAAKAKNILFKTSLYSLAFALTALSAGTKEIIVVLPFLIIILDWFFLAQGNWNIFLKRIPIHLMFITILFLSLIKLNWNVINYIPKAETAIPNNRGNIITSTPKEKITVFPFFISQFKVILHYITMYFWPFNISFDYPYKISNSFFDPDTIFPFLILLTIFLSAIYLFIKDKTNIFTFIVLWFFIATLPRASFIPGTELVCDYKSYLASFSIILFLAIASLILISFFSEKIQSLFKNKKYINYQTALICLMLLLIGYATKKRNIVWSDEELFWKKSMESAPNKPRNYNNYAVALASKGKKQEAIKIYEQACKIDPTYAEPVINMAFIYHAAGKKDLALKYYTKAVNLNEGHPELFYNLGILHSSDKRYTQAENCFKLALKIKPYYSKTHHQLGKIYYQQNQYQKALECFKKAIDGDFPAIDHYYMHAITAKTLNQYDLAISSFESIKKTNPKYKNTLFALASCYYETRNYAKASENFKILYDKFPNQKIFAYNYGQSLLNMRNYKEALPLFKKCESEQNFTYVKQHIKRCLDGLEKIKRA